MCIYEIMSDLIVDVVVKTTNRTFLIIKPAGFNIYQILVEVKAQVKQMD